MAETFNWAILGAGRIARKFASSLREVPEAKLVAVGSRSPERAQSLALEFGALRHYSSYEMLVADKDVQAVYVATRHPDHLPAMRLCLKAGKPTLCEKPFTVNAAEARAAIDLARQERVFLMEAMWTRFFPAMARLREILARSQIGAPTLFQADFGFRNDWKPEGRHLNLALGGGALLDLGIYMVSFSSMLFGRPTEIRSSASIGVTGVDENCGIVLRHARGEISTLTASITTDTRKEAIISGPEGRIEISAPFWKPSVITVHMLKGGEERIEAPYSNFGYQFEIAHVMECLRAGRLESDLMPLDETLAVMETLDAIRAPWPLRYPGESGALP